MCGDGEFIIFTALALKNKSFGQVLLYNIMWTYSCILRFEVVCVRQALEFVWAQDSGTFATRESSTRVKGKRIVE